MNMSVLNLCERKKLVFLKINILDKKGEEIKVWPYRMRQNR
jgi:hypothetical protein